jgi:hypothetical protein
MKFDISVALVGTFWLKAVPSEASRWPIAARRSFAT